MSCVTLLAVALGVAVGREVRLPCCAVAVVSDIASATAPVHASIIRMVGMIPSHVSWVCGEA